MTTAEKSEAILKAILDRCNSEPDKEFAFQADWGDHTATLLWNGRHTHVGEPCQPPTRETWDKYISDLYELLVNGRGMSWE